MAAKIESCVVYGNRKYLVGDVVTVYIKGYDQPYKGRLKYIFAKSFELDMSEKYNSKSITIVLDDIILIE